MYRDRKVYFAALFSSFILFSLLIFLKKPIYLNEDKFNILYFIPSIFIPTVLLFLKKKSIYTKVTIGYIPIIIGFILSITIDNALYFLASFPIFLVSFFVIFPRGKDERLYKDS